MLKVHRSLYLRLSSIFWSIIRSCQHHVTLEILTQKYDLNLAYTLRRSTTNTNMSMNLLSANFISQKCLYSIGKSFYIVLKYIFLISWLIIICPLTQPRRALQPLRNTITPVWFFVIYFNWWFDRIICYQAGTLYFKDTLKLPRLPETCTHVHTCTHTHHHHHNMNLWELLGNGGQWSE